MTVIDAKAREQALDPTRSWLIHAPAGSGKTELLIQRYLKLLAGVDYPEQILAMTFTRKAAGEMKSRILAALENAERNIPPENKHQEQTLALARAALLRNDELGWRILNHPGRLQIQTIDSFCASLTRQIPILSQMGGTLQIEENPAFLYRETAHRLLARVESDTPMGDIIRSVLWHLDNDKSSFIIHVVKLLQKRDQWLLYFFDAFPITDEWRTRFEEAYAEIITARLRAVHQKTPDWIRSQLIPFARYAGENLQNSSPDDIKVQLKDLNALPPPDANRLPQWQAIARFLLTTEGELRQPGGVNVKIGFPSDKDPRSVEMKNGFIAILENLQEHPEWIEWLSQIPSLPSPRFTNEQWSILKALLYLLQETTQTLRMVFAEQGKTDFAEIALAAHRALGTEDNPTDLMLYLDIKLQHILVDEYQDTSYKQFHLLNLLTAGWERDKGRTLFIVGDPKQSIFRFRDAEVGLFLQTQEDGFPNVRLETLTLQANFRSQKKVVDWVNDCFRNIFPPISDRDRGAIAYSESHSVLPEADGPGVVLHPQGDKDGLNEAVEIDALVRAIRAKDPEKSIAILVRARNHLDHIIKRFRKTGVPFKSDQIDRLAHQPVIQDLLALLRALLSRTDRVAWLSILRAPWCGLSLSDLLALCRSDTQTPVIELMRDPARFESLSPDGETRLNRVFPILQDTLQMIPFRDFRNALESCWIALGGPACVKGAARQDVEVFFDEVERISGGGDIEHLHRFDETLEGLYANVPGPGENLVQIMTMHKAKGLEFDYVILPGLGRKPKPPTRSIVSWIPHGTRLLVAPKEETGTDRSASFGFLAKLDKEKDDCETLRLLYVAATRTRNQLHLFGHAPVNDKGEALPEAGSLLARLWSFVGTNWKTPAPIPPASADAVGIPASVTPSTIPRITRLPAEYSIPEPEPDIQTGPTPDLIQEKTKPQFLWAGTEARSLGIVLHQCFQSMADEGIQKWDRDRLRRFAPNLRSALQAQGLHLQKAEELANRGMDILRQIVADPTAQWILAPHPEARSEFPLTGIISHQFANRILDRTFVDNGVRWIIDYKTGEHEGGDPERFFNEEKERYRVQLEQYETLLKLMGETRPIRKALYYPLHAKLVEYENS